MRENMTGMNHRAAKTSVHEVRLAHCCLLREITTNAMICVAIAGALDGKSADWSMSTTSRVNEHPNGPLPIHTRDQRV